MKLFACLGIETCTFSHTKRRNAAQLVLRAPGILKRSSKDVFGSHALRPMAEVTMAGSERRMAGP